MTIKKRYWVFLDALNAVRFESVVAKVHVGEIGPGPWAEL